MRWLALLLVLLCGVAIAAPTAPAQPSEKERIEDLIAVLGRSPGAVFIRNGSEHDASEAAAHLRLKWKNAGKRVRTAEDFIRLCATESSVTGRKYRIRFASGHEMDAADYLRIELWRFDAAAKLKPTQAPMPKPAPPPASTPG